MIDCYKMGFLYPLAIWKHDFMYRKNGEVDIMAISYRKLWIQLIDRNMNKTELREVSGITTNALAALGKDERVTTDVLNKICLALKCDIGDIMEIIPDEEYKKRQERAKELNPVRKEEE